MIRFDGGLATTLQQRGLPVYTPVNDWLLACPEQIARVHREFVVSGCDTVLAATFRALPSVDSRWQLIAAAAVTAVEACGAPWWASIGPGKGALDLVNYLVERGAVGVMIETFVSGDELVNTLLELASVAVPRVASLVVADSGRLYDGSPVADVAYRCLDAGAVAVGLNCAPVPAALAALVALPAEVPVVLRPSPAAQGGLAACVPVAHRLFGLGGCCGATPEDLRRLWQAIDGR